MAKFVINKGYGNEKEVVADSFVEKESFVVFANDHGKERVYAVPTHSVQSIERVNS